MTRNRTAVIVLQQMLAVFEKIYECLQPAAGDKEDLTRPVTEINLRKLYDKQDVMQMLRISSRTFDRYKQLGIIETMRIGKRDFITPASLRKALLLSQRKGRY